jgi:hypothetical protein
MQLTYAYGKLMRVKSALMVKLSRRMRSYIDSYCRKKVYQDTFRAYISHARFHKAGDGVRYSNSALTNSLSEQTRILLTRRGRSLRYSTSRRLRVWYRVEDIKRNRRTWSKKGKEIKYSQLL